MPPRLPVPQGLRTLSLCLRPSPASTTTPALSHLPLIQTANVSQKTKEKRKEMKRRMKQDPYGWAQTQQRKNANLRRRAELEAERKEAWGSPIHGITTPFVESFDSGGQAPLSTPPVDGDGNPLAPPHELPISPHLANYLLTKEEIEQAIEQSKRLTKPLDEDTHTDLKQHEENVAKAIIALQRITDLNNGSAKDRKHANKRRCIETFGRHVTDVTLDHAAPHPSINAPQGPKPVRAGPDTGSSEVQIAILTSKIRAVALSLEGHKGYKDKNNKRSLRLLLHKRQRLLKYMEKKERGSERWQFMLKTLGITPACWKNQIEV
ncbi:hypothetical protein QC762_604930 [Podospora pseudocomata]|uniref:Mitochondrial SSU ribosomal protein S15 n=1 Tax=Podospora pseudocomata TaxID=2093779 RepID=A0ABR0G6P6_9PEZI|nr:hypothetical protein QC762_604930 [Podospora pseudocomata]